VVCHRRYQFYVHGIHLTAPGRSQLTCSDHHDRLKYCPISGPCKSRCIQYVSYNSSFKYCTAALSGRAITIHYISTSFRAEKKYAEDYRHSPPYTTDMLQKFCCKSELSIPMVIYLHTHKAVQIKYMLNDTQEKLIHLSTLPISQL